MRRHPAWPVVAVASLALPLAVPALLPLERLPPGLVYALTGGRWLIAIGLALTAWLALAEAVSWRPAWRPRWAPIVARGAALPAGALLAAAGLLAFCLAMPGYRWSAERFSGDEPKYLRMAESLYRDLDVDLGSAGDEPRGIAALRRNVRGLRFALHDSLYELARDPWPDAPAREWRAGHWTVAGLHGGSYPVHGAGLPLLLLPARALQPLVDPDRPWSLVFVTLGLFYAVGLLGTARLAAAICGAHGAGRLAAVLVFAAAPLLVGAHHVYPETAAVALVPWLALALVHPGGITRARRALLVGLACGFLPWLHVKLFPLAAVLGLLLVVRTRAHPRALAAGLTGGALLVAPLLLYTHHVTGLLRPDAFYLRYDAQAYLGGREPLAPRVLNGLAVALVGAHDGLLVMAPIAIAGLIAVPLLARRERRVLPALGALFGAVWCAAALHGGGAPGPPGRLLTPVLPLLAVPLALGLTQLGERLSWRWTVGLLALVTLSISAAQAGSWRRVADPYEGLFATPAAAFARDLPEGPRAPGEPGPATERGRELLRAAVPLGAIAFWAWRFARAARRPPRAVPAWQMAWRFQAAAWATLSAVATLARALR